MFYKVAYGESRKARVWHNDKIAWEELRKRLQTPLRTAETVAEYHKMKSAGKSAAKDKGGFVAGELKDGKRNTSSVVCRSMLTLDVDNAKKTFLDEYMALSSYSTLIYSTHSHTPENPRLRLVIPLTREISPDEYQAITRYFAFENGINQFDPCSFIPSQLMFWPTASIDGEYIFQEVEGAALDPDLFLSRYPTWKDPTTLPTTLKEKPLHEKSGSKVEDPLKKEGIVGAFCRAVGTIQEAIDTYLPDVYEQVAPNRYKYRPSSSIAGVLIFDDKFAYSNHATDPAYHQECNAFDLVRIHKFPDEDEKKSFSRMAEWATKEPVVSRQLLREKQEEATAEFDNWTDRLKRDKGGNIANSLQNICLIMTHDDYMKNIVFNQLADNMEVKGPLPWDHSETAFWREADDAQLMCYVDQNYGTFSKLNYETAVTKCCDDRKYHPIKEYFKTLPPWDKVPRVDSLLIDYLGSDDNPYVRAVTRKTLCAAVMRIKKPGIKFDPALVLNGPQGIGKSTLIARLGMEWFSDSLTLSDMNDGKAAPEKLQGYWIHEIGEMAGMRKAELEKVKSFVSRQDDKYRVAFGRRVTSHPRQCVFFGTTNAENGFLRDITGNRRFWVVKTPGGGAHHPWELDEAIIDQIWAEALVYAEDGEALFLSPELEEMAKREQAAAMESDPREGLVRQYLEILLPEKWPEMDIYARREYLRGDDPASPKGTVVRTTVSNMEIWCECFGMPKESLKGAESFSISAMMSRIEGWKRSNELFRTKLYGPQRVYKKV